MRCTYEVGPKVVGSSPARNTLKPPVAPNAQVTRVAMKMYL